MSNKSGTSSQVISLPKGGGALQGIGETFSPDLFTGTGNFTVPITLPPGRNGFQPELNLVYSTGNGNGPFGLGWGLSIPGVSRKTSKGVPRYQDNSPDLKDHDTFVLSGAEDLVPISDLNAGGVTQYRPRTEGLFARIEHQQDAGNDCWEVRSKDGLVSLYGTKEQRGNDPAVVADPDNRRKVCSWMLSRTGDPFGNHILYDYQRDMGEDGPHQWDQLYLERIRYVDYDKDGVTNYLVSVTFLYEDRPDLFSSFRCGFEIRTRLRCTAIEIRTHAKEDRLVRSYDLIYLDQRGDLEDPEQCLPANGVSLLSQIKVIGHDGVATEELPPLEFDYTRFEPESRDFLPVAGRELPARSLASSDLELADLFGNGLPDILEMNSTVRYWRNRGGGRFDLPRAMQDAPAGLQLADPGVQLIDANGDGRIDLLATKNGLSGYFPLNFQGAWDRRSFQRYRQAPSFNLADPEVQLVDVNGDGVTDAVRSGSRFEYFFNDPSEGWNGTRRVPRRDLDVFPNVNFSDPRVRWADVTGDGLQDIVLIYDGNVEYWPNLGHGNWGRRIHMRNGPRFPHGYDPRRILIGDVDGDGLADLMYVDHRKVVLHINQSGNGWSDPIEIDGTPPVTDMDAVRLVDMLGTGIGGVLWSADANGQGRPHMFFLDFTGGIKPYLMNKMDNHRGAVTQVVFAPSNRFYLEAEQDPKTRWKTALPFPVQVVARVEVVDEISRGKLTTEYRYHHGYWDGAEREFRGFGRVDQRDTEVFEDYKAASLHPDRPFEAVATQSFSPPTETRTWFHQGPIGEEFGDWFEADYSEEFFPGDPQRLERPVGFETFLHAADIPRRVKRDAIRALRGRILRTELYAVDDSDCQDRPFTVTEHLHSVREEDAPANLGDQSRPRIFFPHTLTQRTTQWERGDDPMAQFSFTDDFDACGNPRRQTQVACPRGWRDLQDRPDQPFLVTRRRTVFAEPADPEVYIMDRVAKTTAYEIENDGSQLVLELRNVPDDSPAMKVIEQTLNFYDGEAFVGRPFGEVGERGALLRSESLVLTEENLHAAYQSGDAPTDPPEVPPYLIPGNSPVATPEYPQEFLDALSSMSGYTFYLGDDEHARGYFVTTARHTFDFNNPDGAARGLLKSTLDPFGSITTIGDYAFDLLPTKVADTAGLVTQARYDERMLQPHEMEDPNGNRTRVAYTPLGLVKHTVSMGKEGEAVGDTDEIPGTRFEYDFFAFENSAFENSPPGARRPVSVRTIQRQHHAHDTQVPPPERDETIETVEYTDGFGRLLQTRTQAEDVTFGDPDFGDGVLPADQAVTPGDVVGRQPAPDDPPNVVISGWQIYDNKGRVVEKFEPFFSQGFAYLSPEDEQTLFGRNVLGQKVTMFYDPRGQVIRTANPDGSEQRVLIGVPGTIAAPDLRDPGVFEPTPWEAYTYDPNDLAPLSQPPGEPGVTLADRAPEEHHFTPASIEVDALGRTTKAVDRNGPDSATDWFTTRSTYDIRGNLLTVTDALERVAFRYTYDLANNPLRTENIDAGVRRVVLDAAGSEVERRDSKGALILQAYDLLQRPVRRWARDDAAGAMTLRERLVYGDGGDPAQDPAERAVHRAENRLGVLHEHYDEASRLTLKKYDFKGNVLEKARQVISDDSILNASSSAFRVDWQPPGSTTLEAHAGALLDPFEYRTSAAYDALNRVKILLYPEDVEGKRKALRPQYNRAGALEQIILDGDVFVDHIAYDAKGQRTFIAIGNGVMTSYAYDPQTFRLARLRSERYTKPDPDLPVYERSGAPLQDFAYDYDLVGNIATIHDRTPDSGVPNTLLGAGGLDRVFTYDPLYRLLSAKGRECDRPPDHPPFDDRPRCVDVTRTRSYIERYEYDPLGNMLRLQHRTNGGGFTRQFSFVPVNNRLAGMTIGQSVFDYDYDANGNLIRETASRHFEWDHSDQMKVFRTQVEGSEPSVHAHYLYDASGQRVKKLVRKQGGGFEATVYIDGLFEHHRWERGGSAAGENNRLHVMDDEQRIAVIRVGNRHPDDRGPAVQHHLGDHLGSSNLVVDEGASFIHREEYTPYGETSFGSFARKRYRFTGKERDEESGLYYHSARYYAPWIPRWISVDPKQSDQQEFSPYVYAAGNPLRFTDHSGTTPTDEETLARHVLEFSKEASEINDQYNAFYEKQEKLKTSVENARKRGSSERTIQKKYEWQFQDLEQERLNLKSKAQPASLVGEALEEQIGNLQEWPESMVDPSERFKPASPMEVLKRARQKVAVTLVGISQRIKMPAPSKPKQQTKQKRQELPEARTVTDPDAPRQGVFRRVVRGVRRFIGLGMKVMGVVSFALDAFSIIDHIRHGNYAEAGKEAGKSILAGGLFLLGPVGWLWGTMLMLDDGSRKPPREPGEGHPRKYWDPNSETYKGMEPGTPMRADPRYPGQLYH